MGDQQSAEEIEAHLHSGATAAAHLFLEATVRFGRYDVAWALMSPNLRLVRAQAWVWANRTVPEVAREDRDDLAAALAGDPFGHELWASFAVTELRVFGEYFQDWWEHLGVGSRPRPAGLDHEVIVFVDEREVQARGSTPDPTGRGTWLNAPLQSGPRLEVLVSFSRGRDWLVENFAAAAVSMPQLGWPPTL